MICKLITFKMSFRIIVRLLFLLMASNEDPRMKAEKTRTFLYFSFLIFYWWYILVGIKPSNVGGLATIWLNIVGAWEKQKSFQRPFYFHLKWFDRNSPISPELLLSFFNSLYSKIIWLQGLNLSCIAVIVHVGLSSRRETTTAKYVGVNELIREILIKIALFHGTIAAWGFCWGISLFFSIWLGKKKCWGN